MALTTLIAEHGNAAKLFGIADANGDGRGTLHIHDRVPWPDTPLSVNLGRESDYAVPLRDETRARLRNDLKVIKSHFSVIETREFGLPPGTRYISVTRNPKDIAVSAYHFNEAIAFGPAAPPLEVIVDTVVLDRTMCLKSWAERAAEDWAARHDADHLFLRYEEMLADKDATVRKVADFMGVKLSESEIEKVIKFNSFSW